MTIRWRPWFTWTDMSGNQNAYGPAEHQVIEMAPELWLTYLCDALRHGWTPPRWWEWWRWSDEPRDAMPPNPVRQEMLRRSIASSAGENTLKGLRIDEPSAPEVDNLIAQLEALKSSGASHTVEDFDRLIARIDAASTEANRRREIRRAFRMARNQERSRILKKLRDKRTEIFVTDGNRALSALADIMVKTAEECE